MMRRCDVAFFVSVGAALTGAALLAGGQIAAAAVAAATALMAACHCRRESRRSPQPMPSGLWWSLLLPSGRHAPRHLLHLLQPKPGQRVLEIGPGVGVHAIPVAQAVAPNGTVAAVDVNPAMLGRMMRRASRLGVSGIEPEVGDARRLHYPDRSFDSAYLISVLGEVPDRPAVWAELRRVLKPGGRLVIGEIALDPDFVRLADTRREAEANGFEFERLVGGRLSYLALFRGTQVAPPNAFPFARQARSERVPTLSSSWFVMTRTLPAE